MADAAIATYCPWWGATSRAAVTSRSRSRSLASAPGAARLSQWRPGWRRVLVTGPLGRAAAGLRRRRDGAELADELVVAHRRPWPRLAEGMAARGAGVHAMMDLSDGIGIDLHRLADASDVGFALDRDVPVAEGASAEEAISGGEDYELLIATDDPGACA
jgi:thiamine-monophosphate kinase